MERNSALPRAVRVVALPAVALLLLTGCSSGASTPSGSPSSTGVGSLSVQGPRSHLELSGGALKREPSGAAELTVTIRNAGTVAEHLSLVTVPGSGRASLQGGQGPANALTAAGVLIGPGETAVFGGQGQGPRILFAAPTGTPSGASASGTVDAILIFSVSGLVHLQVPTTG